MRRILDVKYKKDDLNKVTTKQCQHLTAIELHRRLHLLNKLEDMFGGTLGIWKTTTVYLELKDAALSITESTQNDVQKGSIKSCEIGIPQRRKLIQMGSTFFCTTKSEN